MSNLHKKHLIIALILIICFIIFLTTYFTNPNRSKNVPSYPKIGLEEQLEQKAREAFNKRISKDLGYEYPIQTKKIEHNELNSLLPNWSFYQAEGGYKLPPGYTLLAIKEGHIYNLPDEFNQMLNASNITINETNGLNVAKVFILTSSPEEVGYSIDFSKQEKIKEYQEKYGYTYEFRINSWSESNGVVKEWRFAAENGQWKAIECHYIDFGVGNYKKNTIAVVPTKNTITNFFPELAY